MTHKIYVPVTEDWKLKKKKKSLLKKKMKREERVREVKVTPTLCIFSVIIKMDPKRTIYYCIYMNETGVNRIHSFKYIPS